MSRLARAWSALTGGDAPVTAIALPAHTVAITESRADSWVNSYTGMGTTRDKVGGSYFLATQIILSGELEALFYGDDIAAKIVGKLPSEMFRRGYDVDGDQAYAVKDAIKDLDLNRKIRLAITWARLYGGAAVVLGIDDGQELDQPLGEDLSCVRGVKFANVIDRRYLIPIQYYTDPSQPHFGEPEIYELVVPVGFSIAARIHASRILRFDGTEVDVVNRQRNGGWSYSVLQRVYDTVQKFANAFGAASQLATDAGQAVFTIKGWSSAVGAAAAAAAARMTMVDQQRSSGRAVVLDADKETFSREGVQLSGLPDLLDRFMIRTAAAAEMPVTILFGQSPAGMNATGESDLTQWYDHVAASQADTVLPALERVAMLVTAGKWAGEFKFHPLREPDDKGRADTEKTQAETWQIYINAGVVLPEEVKLAEFADIPVDVDVEALQAIIEAEQELAANPPPPPPPGAIMPGVPGNQLPAPAEQAVPAAAPAPRGDSFRESNEAFLADLKDYRAIGLRLDQETIEVLAEKHGIPTPPKLAT